MLNRVSEVGATRGYDRSQAQYADDPQALNGLLVIANRVSEATGRLQGVSHALQNLAFGIHGPRPETDAGARAVDPVKDDSLNARIGALLREVESVEYALNSVMR